MQGVLVWGSVVIINVLVFALLYRPRYWNKIVFLPIFLAAFLSDIIAHIILSAIEGAGQVLMWIIISFPIVGFVGFCSIIIVQVLYINLFKKKLGKHETQNKN